MLPTDNAERKALPLWDFMFGYFPDAWVEVAKVAVSGNEQHNPGEPLHWAREKSTDQLNTAFRHLFDHGKGQVLDTDECYHLAKAIWRLSAELQLIVERKQAGEVPAQHVAREESGQERRPLRAEPVTAQWINGLYVEPPAPASNIVLCLRCGVLEAGSHQRWCPEFVPEAQR